MLYSRAEASSLEKQVARARAEEIKLISQQGETVVDLRPPPPYPGEKGVKIKEGAASSAKKNADDLDAYLLGALDSGDEAAGTSFLSCVGLDFFQCDSVLWLLLPQIPVKM